MGLRYADLKRTHPEYDPVYWAKCRALFAGGKALWKNQKILCDIFPRHANEQDNVYQERLRRADYIAYPEEIIGHLVAALFAEPIKMKGEPEPPPFYQEFFDDTSNLGGNAVPFNELLRKQILTALICQTAWTLVDLPDEDDWEDDAESPRSEAEEEAQGRLRAYCVPLAPENVIDWEEDHDGRLLRAMVATCSNRRLTLDSKRETYVETYTHYTWEGWQRFIVTYDKGKPIPDQMELEKIPNLVVQSGEHSFDAVPLVRLCLPEGLWAMGKLEPMARDHFNSFSALGWATLRSLFPQLYEFLGPEEPFKMPLGEAQQDPGRAFNQTRGMGYVQTRGQNDKAEYVGPASTSFDFAQKRVESLRDEMHRVTHLMALSVDNKAQNVAKSGVSKQHDRAATAVVLTELGNRIRRHAIEICQMAAKGRKDPEIRWAAHGMENFDQMSADEASDEMVKLATFKDLIPSPTYWRLKAFEFARLDLGPNAEDEDLEKIEEELEGNVTDEEFDPQVQQDREMEMLKMKTMGGAAKAGPPQKKPPQNQAKTNKD